jgi:hypothetical protein
VCEVLSGKGGFMNFWREYACSGKARYRLLYCVAAFTRTCVARGTVIRVQLDIVIHTVMLGCPEHGSCARPVACMRARKRGCAQNAHTSSDWLQGCACVLRVLTRARARRRSRKRALRAVGEELALRVSASPGGVLSSRYEIVVYMFSCLYT